jgi:nucleotide-binding universal stress UspA family protein
MFEKILLPVDFTEKNARAVEAALELGAGRNLEVTLLHIIETLDLPFEELEDFYQKLHEQAATELDRLAEPLSQAGAKVVQHIEYGRRVPEIVGYAQENAIDLIILSSRRLNLEEPPEGLASISHQVAILAQTPVLLVK